MTAPTNHPGETSAPADRGERVLAELRERLCRRLPEWRRRGPEDPAWVLLEALAQGLGELWTRVESLEDRAFDRVLEALGEEPGWAAPADGVVVFVPPQGLRDPVLVPRGTVVSAPRAPGGAKIAFETADDAWLGSSRLLRAVSCAGESQTELFPYPQGGWDAEAVPLFGEQARPVRYLYLGDPILGVLRDRRARLLLEWQGSPGAVTEGSWELSVAGGWRAFLPEIEESRSLKGKRVLKVWISGPAPDLAEAEVEGASSPWVRLALPGARRLVLQQPSWAGLETEAGVAPSDPSLAAGTGRSSPFPRPVLRVLSNSFERWEDHSLSGRKIAAVDSPEAWYPALYLGWEKAAPASVYFKLEGSGTPEGWGGAGSRRSPRLIWERSTGRGFRAFEVKDATQGFTRSGTVSWGIPADWNSQEQFGERLYWVRARWADGTYFAPPHVRAVLPHAAAIRQGCTLRSQLFETSIDRWGRGAVPVSRSGGEPERFDVIELQKDDGEWERLVTGERARLPASPELAPSGTEKITATSAATRAETGAEQGGEPSRPGRFSLKRDTRGLYILSVDPRWFGSRKVRVPEMRAGLGAHGNLPPGTLRLVEADIPGLQEVLQPLPTDGGRGPEDPTAFRGRVMSEWKTGDRAVALSDFRRLCLGLDSEIARVEAMADVDYSGTVILTVLPVEPCRPGRFSPAKLAWLSETLGAKAPLGTSVVVVEAVYLPVEAHFRATERTACPPDSARKLLEARLRRFLHPLHGGPDGRGFPGERWLKDDGPSDIMTFVLGQQGRGPLAAAPIPHWESHLWRFKFTGQGGAELGEVLADSLELVASPFIMPVLERLVFEQE